MHLLKLAVGADSLDHLKGWAARQADSNEKRTGRRTVSITTRSQPKRADEITAGGSLYWVIKGVLAARQPILAFEPFKDGDGIGRIRIIMGPEVTAVRPRPCRPFQGWRYLRADDAPPDWTLADIDEAMPQKMRRDLMELCLI